MGKQISKSTNLDPDCICGWSSRCKTHSDESKPLRILATFAVCEYHHNGLEVDSTHLDLSEETFNPGRKLCDAGSCCQPAYAVYGIGVTGQYVPEPSKLKRKKA